MNKKILKISILILALFVDLTILLTVNNSVFALLLVCYISIFAKMLCNYRSNAMMLAFLICFFVFLVGRPFVYEVFGYYRDSGIKIDDEARNCMYLCLLVSLLALYCGYYICKKNRFRKREAHQEYTQCNFDKPFCKNLRKVSFYATIIMYIMAITENILRFLFVREVGYEASYYLEHDYAYGMPFILHALAMSAPVALAIFLATLPNKKEVRLPVGLFLISNFISSMSGNRFEVIASIIAIVVYYVWRSNSDKGNWINRKLVIIGVIFSPILILLMQGMAYWRSGVDLYTDVNPIMSFMYENGGSSNQIAAVHQYKGVATNEDAKYSFGGIWRSIQESGIANMFGLGESYRAQTVEYARNSYSLGASLTYYFYPTQYLTGYGLGGCYIAELYHDF